MTKGGDIEQRIRALLTEHPDMPKTEMADLLGISRKTLYKHLGRMTDEPQPALPATPAQPTKKKEISGKSHKKELHPHDGRRQNKGKPPPGPHSSGFKRGNDAATITGVNRNPLLHGVSPERKALVSGEDKSPADLIRDDIELYRWLLMDLNQELEAVKASKAQWVWLGSTYTRQEGDGELMGTGRISQRKRMPKLEAITRLSKDVAQVLKSLDSALDKLHKMLQAEQGQRKKGFADFLAAMVQGGEDDE